MPQKDEPDSTSSSDAPADVPRETKGDIAHSVVRAAASLVPGAGPPLAEIIFGQLVKRPIERRRDAWMESMGNALGDLIQRVDGLEESLQDDEAFTSTLLEASQIAVRTHQEEKLEALRNAILNSALRREPDEDLRAIFLNLVERFTPWHIRILRLYDDPESKLKAAGVDYTAWLAGGANRVLEEVYPELKDQRVFYDLLVNDLSATGLFSVGSLHGVMSSSGMVARRTTELGRRFLMFISAPSV